MTDKINISAEAVAAMLNGVTPGPWAAAGRFVDTHVLQIADLNAGRTGHEDANARFIAWAREAVPALAARLVEVEKSRMDLAGDKINLRSENIALQARAEAAEALLSEAVKAGMLEGAKVKPLAWEDWSARHRTNVTAMTEFGRYGVMQLHFPEMHYKIEPPHGKPSSADTLEAAKDAAQADYEARIRAALDEPDPETISRIVAQLKEGRE